MQISLNSAPEGARDKNTALDLIMFWYSIDQYKLIVYNWNPMIEWCILPCISNQFICTGTCELLYRRDLTIWFSLIGQLPLTFHSRKNPTLPIIKMNTKLYIPSASCIWEVFLIQSKLSPQSPFNQCQGPKIDSWIRLLSLTTTWK